jgi:phosphatidylinositol 4-kinase type 2
MPRSRPATSGYARLSQADEEENRYSDDSGDEDPLHAPRTISYTGPQYAPIQPRPSAPLHAPTDTSPNQRRRPHSHKRRGRANSSVDIKAINARLERWADEIASKFKIRKIKGKSHDEEKLEIHHTVFQAPEGMQPATAESLQTQFAENEGGRMSKAEFDDIVESVRTAIELGMHPKMISKGSSGSYFARNTDGKVVGVFKPKDEEPYATRNPKWTKWIHRNLFPCFFGRACLIPNLSYVSEAAAYVLDCRLRTNIVPYTDVIHLSSKAFYYDFWQRSAFYRRRKPLPEKPGSFQVFLKGYKDATEFFREHPWPDQINSGFRPQDAPKSRRRPWTENCRATLLNTDDEEESSAAFTRPPSADGRMQQRFYWSSDIQQSFKEELEKLVILDYIMRNTDRGLDNWMIKVDWENQDVSIVSEPPKLNTDVSDEDHPVPSTATLQEPYRRQEAMTPISRSGSPGLSGRTAPMPTNISIGAIDNSLSWPWKHPDAVS